MSPTTEIDNTISDNINDRLKDPIIGTFATSFLLFNWDLFIVLLNYKGDFHSNIHYIKSALSPLKSGFVFTDFNVFISSDLRGWHFLRFIFPIITTYVWLFKWPIWTKNWFEKIHTFKFERENIINKLKDENLKMREEIITVKEENLSLKEKNTDSNLNYWMKDFQDLHRKEILNNLIHIANNKNDSHYLNSTPEILSSIYMYQNLGLLDVTRNVSNGIFSVSLTEKGQFFYKQALTV